MAIRMVLAIAGGALVALIIYAAIVVVANRSADVPALRELDTTNARSNSLNDGITVTTWNIGYAGLGQESDFVMDGGRHWFPPSRSIVEKNLRGILQSLDAFNTDVLLLQELAGASILTYGLDPKKRVVDSHPDMAFVYDPSIRTRLLPSRLRLEIGNGTLLRGKVLSAKSELISLEPKYEFGLFRRQYRTSTIVVPGRNGNTEIEWSFINIHLAAFDDDATTRHRQLRDVLELAEREYRLGRFVVVGGDWNMVLNQTEYEHRTEAAYLFWIHDFPSEMIATGWQLVSDETVPSVRTVQIPYEEGVNFRTTIDGFLVSPNVDVIGIETTDLRFEYTDHQPVTVRLRAKR